MGIRAESGHVNQVGDALLYRHLGDHLCDAHVRLVKAAIDHPGEVVLRLVILRCREGLARTRRRERFVVILATAAPEEGYMGEGGWGARQSIVKPFVLAQPGESNIPRGWVHETKELPTFPMRLMTTSEPAITRRTLSTFWGL